MLLHAADECYAESLRAERTTIGKCAQIVYALSYVGQYTAVSKQQLVLLFTVSIVVLFTYYSL